MDNESQTMSKKNREQIKRVLIYLAWGLAAMIIAFLLMLVAGIAGWGV